MKGWWLWGHSSVARLHLLEGCSWVAASLLNHMVLFIGGFQFFAATIGSRSLGDTHDC